MSPLVCILIATRALPLLSVLDLGQTVVTQRSTGQDGLGRTSSVSAAAEVTRRARNGHRLRLAVSGSAGPPLPALSTRRSAFELRLGLLLRLLLLRLRLRLLLRALVRRVLVLRALLLRVLALLCRASMGDTPGGLHAHAAHLCLHTPQMSALHARRLTEARCRRSNLERSMLHASQRQFSRCLTKTW